jgi:SAM-dependent methyltransferase
MTDKQTISTYDANVETYRALVDKLPEVKHIRHFISLVPSDATILDLGCGVGNAAAEMKKAGLNLVCVDASAEMVRTANELFGLGATVSTFADLDAVEVFDGIWANFSLLHAAKADFAGHLRAIYTALKPSGLFFIALKIGDGEHRDKLGRLYAYYQEDELDEILQNCGFVPAEKRFGALKGMAGDVEDWIGVFSRKPALP